MAKENKISYLIGAGASFNALPIVNQIPDKLREMKEYIEQFNFDKNSQHIKLEDLGREIDIIQNHASIDTLARKYWLKHKPNFIHEDYQFIKNIITCLLIYCQITKKEVINGDELKKFKKVKKKYLLDPRYDAFLSAILTDQFQLPENISIISWNYDYQIEKALNFFIPEKSLMETGKHLGIDYFVVKNETNIIKLNGTSFFVDGVDSKFNYNIYSDELHSIMFDSLKKKTKNNIFSGIKFAWEIESQVASSNRKMAATKIEESEYIVIIGYSFPIFNREVDIQLFKNIDNCKAIYIQDTADRVELIKNQLDAINPKINKSNLVKFQTDLNQFLIPNEYWAEEPKRKVKRVAKVF